jgi:plastocyanin
MWRVAAASIAAAALTSSVAGAAVSTRGAGTAEEAARAPVVIRLGEFFFRPRRVTVHVGQRVVFVNVGKIDHTVADTDDRHQIRSKLIRPRPLAHGQKQVVRFGKPGTVEYLCTFHPTLMRGSITVVP